MRFVARSLTLALRRSTLATALPFSIADLVQDVFLSAFQPKARAGIDGTRPYGPYLRAIGRNLLVDQLRRSNRLIVIENELLFRLIEGREVMPPSVEDDPGALECVDECLRSLSPELRLVYQALYVDGLSQREAATLLGVGRQTIRTRVERLHGELRRSVSGRLLRVSVEAANPGRSGADGSVAGLTSRPAEGRTAPRTRQTIGT